MSKRGSVLELAVLGLLHQSPMHGYELRKRLSTTLGAFRAFSYGSLYPCLKSLVERGLIVEDTATVENDAVAPPLTAKRAKIVYRLTADGKDYLQNLLAEAGPAAWEDENFGVHFAFFGQTDADVRLRILEGRRSRLEERLENVRSSVARARDRLDTYTLELQQHGLESVEREVRWLNELISTERISQTELSRSAASSASAASAASSHVSPSTTTTRRDDPSAAAAHDKNKE